MVLVIMSSNLDMVTRFMINKGMYTSNKDDWETPQELFDELKKEFDIRFDVCASEQNAKYEHFWTKEDDCLSKQWTLHIGAFWMNPPYGRQIAKFIKKASFESQLHDSKVIMLLPARTDTKWFHDYIYNKAEIRFLKGRLKFSNSKNSAPFPSMIVIFRGRTYDN